MKQSETPKHSLSKIERRNLAYRIAELLLWSVLIAATLTLLYLNIDINHRLQDQVQEVKEIQQFNKTLLEEQKRQHQAQNDLLLCITNVFATQATGQRDFGPCQAAADSLDQQTVVPPTSLPGFSPRIVNPAPTVSPTPRVESRPDFLYPRHRMTG
jgi:hypothetical protein